MTGGPDPSHLSDLGESPWEETGLVREGLSLGQVEESPTEEETAETGQRVAPGRTEETHTMTVTTGQ